MRPALLWPLALTLAVPAVRAEPAGEALGAPNGKPHGEAIYVIEQLVVGVTDAPGPNGERIGQVKSGDKLDLIERQGDEAHVQLPNGKEGWIKSSYLSTQEPLQHRLTERTAEVEKLKQDVGRLESQLAAARVAHNATSARPPAAAPAPTPPAANTPAETIPPAVADALSGGATPVRETVFLRSPEQPGQTPWPLVLGTAVLMLLAGFVLGWKTLDRRIRQKYGGLRIY